MRKNELVLMLAVPSLVPESNLQFALLNDQGLFYLISRAWRGMGRRSFSYLEF